jgi:cytochrome c
MKAVWTGIVAASAFLLIGVAQADQGLAQSSGCMACHTVDKKLVGPGFKDVAAKYKGDATAAASLAGMEPRVLGVRFLCQQMQALVMKMLKNW